MRSLIRWVAQLGASPDESDSLRAQRLVLIGMSLGLVPVAGTLWSSTYYALGELDAMYCVQFNVVWMLGCFAWIAIGKHYGSFRVLAMTGLMFPVVTGLALGSYAESGGIIMLGVSVPLISLLDGNVRRAFGWLLFFYAQVFASAFVERTVLYPDRQANSVVDSWVPNTILLGAVMFAALAYATRKREEALRDLARERERSEELLLNVLPPEVIETLKSGPEIIAEPYDDASILFADVVGFTPLSETLPAREVVGLLNEVFSHFDSLCEKHGVEKIRTIGDGYMVASGIPTTRPDHAQALAAMALDMMRYVGELKSRGGSSLSFRIGINSGPLVAGVIGRKKFQYDVWGDTVNTAARMESHGQPGRIQVTSDTRDRLGDAFVCTSRGEIDVKGKGRMQTWFLEEAAAA